MASLQWHCIHAALVRVHAEGGTTGDPYLWSVSVTHDSGHYLLAVLEGAVGQLKVDMARAVTRRLKEEGFHGWRFERRNMATGRERIFWFKGKGPT